MFKAFGSSVGLGFRVLWFGGVFGAFWTVSDLGFRAI